MSRYTFTFKKDDVFVEFTTADKEIVERQFQIWVTCADDYVNNRPIRTFEAPTRTSVQQKEEIIEEAKVVQPAPVVEEAIEQTQPIQEEAVQPEAIQSEPIVAEEVLTIEETQTEEQPEVFDTASSLLKTINTIQNPPAEEPAPTVNFEDVLEKSIENPTFEPNRVKDQVFLNLIKSKNTTDKFHYLMVTAYYLSEFEKMERFSLKQINSKLMYNLSEVIDHAKLQEAINQGLIELVPDLTGMSEVDEYRITRQGEEFFANKI